MKYIYIYRYIEFYLDFFIDGDCSSHHTPSESGGLLSCHSEM